MTVLVDSYRTVSFLSKGEYSEKRSKFLAFALHVETEEEVKTIVQQYRKDFFDARHVCYAYVLGTGVNHFRTNDDGEPSGTAGRPILGQIRAQELTDTLVIVVRYYGGINLGTGGLVVAYKTATANALQKATIEIRTVCEQFSVRVPYEKIDLVLRRLKKGNIKVMKRDYEATHTILTISVQQSQKELLKQDLERIYTVEIVD